MSDGEEERSTVDVAVVGAAGAVGEAMVALLEEREFPVGTLFPVDLQDLAGGRAQFRGRYLRIEALERFDFSRVRLALFAGGDEVSARHVPLAIAAGCMVVDGSSAFRNDDAVPIVVPEVNPGLAGAGQRGVVAGPCSASIPLLLALKPVHDAFGVQRVDIATYQAVSAIGRRGVEELGRQTADLLNLQEIRHEALPAQIAFNVIPHIGEFDDSGYTTEELAVAQDIRRVLDEPELAVNVTCVQVPVFFGHSAAVHIRTRDRTSAEAVRAVLEGAPGVEVQDERVAGGYPTAVTDAAGSDPVFIGRIRTDRSDQHGVNLWVVADNVRKGAALNGVQIAEILVKDYL